MSWFWWVSDVGSLVPMGDNCLIVAGSSDEEVGSWVWVIIV